MESYLYLCDSILNITSGKIECYFNVSNSGDSLAHHPTLNQAKHYCNTKGLSKINKSKIHTLFFSDFNQIWLHP